MTNEFGILHGTMMKQKENRQRANVVHWAVMKRMTVNGAYTQKIIILLMESVLKEK